jgi:hypothetical protein
MTSAVITAIAGTWIAAGGTWIALRQMLIANEKLQFDAFHRQYERRVAVYEATREFLASAFHGNISEDALRAYRLHTLEAVSKLQRGVLKSGQTRESEAPAIPGGFDVDPRDPGRA